MFDTDSKNLRPPGTLTKAKVMNVDGEPIIETREAFTIDDNGVLHETDSTHYTMSHDGRRMKVGDLIAVSWTGVQIPEDRLYSCLNPFGHHDYRLVYLEIDGFATDLGNILCTECLEANGRRQTLRLLTLGIYNPEEF